MKRKYFYFDAGNGRRYSLSLEIDHYENMRAFYKYTFKTPDKKILFKGNDFSCYAGDDNKWKENAMSLMGFLTLRKGDTDDEYFNNYTDDQLAFSESNDNDELQMMVYDYDTRNEK